MHKIHVNTNKQTKRNNSSETTSSLSFRNLVTYRASAVVGDVRTLACRCWERPWWWPANRTAATWWCVDRTCDNDDWPCTLIACRASTTTHSTPSHPSHLPNTPRSIIDADFHTKVSAKSLRWHKL